VIRDFNIRDNNWDPSYPHHFIHADIFRKVADLFNLKLSMPIAQILIRYINNSKNFNSMIDIMFLWANAKEFDTHTIFPDLQSLSDHAYLIVNIIIREKFIQDKTRTIVKNSK